MIEFKSIKDHVYEYLSTKINEGDLRPKEKINDKIICDALKVSRTPVREALIELTNEGYLERTPRHGFRVKVISLVEVKEIYEIIGSLEGLAAERALSRLKEEDYLCLEKLISKMDEFIKNKKRHDFYHLQRDFHDIYIKACGNSRLFDMLFALKNRFRQVYAFHESKEALYSELQQFNDEHREIVKLFRKGNVPELQKYLKDVHWAFTYAKLDSDIA